MIGAQLAVELVNLRRTDAWSVTTVEAALARGLVRFDHLDEETLCGVARVADQLGSIFGADGIPERCKRINGLLAGAVQRVHLALHDDLPPHLHFAGLESGLIQRVLAATTGGLVIFAVESGGERMGTCARSECGRVFLDTSKNGRRTYCSAQCGNTEAVRRYRKGPH